MLGDVDVQHELSERTLQTCEFTMNHYEARAGQLCGGAEVQRAARGKIDVIERRKVEVARFAPSLLFDVGVLGLTIGYRADKTGRNKGSSADTVKAPVVGNWKTQGWRGQLPRRAALRTREGRRPNSERTSRGRSNHICQSGKRREDGLGRT